MNFIEELRGIASAPVDLMGNILHQKSSDIGVNYDYWIDGSTELGFNVLKSIKDGDNTYFSMYMPEYLGVHDLTEGEYFTVYDFILRSLDRKLFFQKDSLILHLPMYSPDSDGEYSLPYGYILIKKNTLIQAKTTHPLVSIRDLNSDLITIPGLLNIDITKVFGEDAEFSVHPIKFIYGKMTKCPLLNLEEEKESDNHIGFLEGTVDGWSPVGGEWWMVDAGYIRDEDNNVIWRKDSIDWSSSVTVRNPEGCYLDSSGNLSIVNGNTSKYYPNSAIRRQQDGSIIRIEDGVVLCAPTTTYKFDGSASITSNIAEKKINKVDPSSMYGKSVSGMSDFVDLGAIADQVMLGFDI